MYYQLTTLSNGLRVVTVPMSGRRSVSLGIWVRAGGRYESRKLSGISHCVEHMLFKGTRRRSTWQIKAEIEGAGGYLNAFTGEESTCYFAKVLQPQLPAAIDVLSDMIQRPLFRADDLEKEKTVILEEIKMYEDQPSHHVQDLINEVLWPNHPLGRPVSGRAETVSSFDRSCLGDFYRRFYHPANLVVAFAGPVRHREAVDWTRRLFKGKPKKRMPRHLPAPAAGQTKSRAVFLEKPSEQLHFVIGVHGFSRYHRDRYKLGLLNIILGGNMTSRLFEEVREKRGLAYEIRSQAGFYQDTGAVTFTAGVEPRKAAATVRLIMKELAKLKKRPVKSVELRRAKDYFMSQFYMALEDSMETMFWAGESVMTYGFIPAAEDIRQNIEAVRPDDLTDVAQRLFKTGRFNMACVGGMSGRLRKEISLQFERLGDE